MKEVKLPHGVVALVDGEDYAKVLEAGRWHLNTGGYALNGRHGLLHRYVLDLPREEFGKPKQFTVDHINHDRLDNRKENLRIVSCAESNRYRRKWVNSPEARVVSRFKGVYFEPKRGNWTAYISFEGKRSHLGLFETDVEAALAYNIAAAHYFGAFAVMNSLDGVEPSPVRSRPKDKRYAHRSRQTPLPFTL